MFGMYAVMGQEIDATIGSPITGLLQKISAMLPNGKDGKPIIPRSYSKPEDLPAWWTDTRMGSEK